MEAAALAEEYVKRTKPLQPIEMQIVKELESPSLIKRLSEPSVCLVALDERGKTFSSRALATQIGLWKADTRIKDLVFVIGGPYGLPEVITKKARLIWGLGELTLPSDLAWVVVAEQLYRAATINKGMSYHHD